MSLKGVEFNADTAQRLEIGGRIIKIVEKMTKSTTTVGGNESLKIHIFSSQLRRLLVG